MAYKKTFAQVLGAYIGRLLGNIVLNFIKAVINGLVLAYPVKLIWNELALLAVFNSVTISFWVAFKIILLTGFLFRSAINSRRIEQDEKELE
ncbi:hypothetical protein F132_1 [Flavobacterium sp. phage 1/32]|nr:hypothetical protein F132_1 [Flavobacterium sp. phage 1/32]